MAHEYYSSREIRHMTGEVVCTPGSAVIISQPGGSRQLSVPVVSQHLLPSSYHLPLLTSLSCGACRKGGRSNRGAEEKASVAHCTGAACTTEDRPTFLRITFDAPSPHHNE